MKQLDPRVISLWRAKGALRLFTFWLPMSAALGFVLTTQLGVATAGGAVGALLALVLTLALAWPPLAWRAFRYEVREHDLLVTQGVLFRHAVSIPLNRIQHVDTRQDPVERIWGLSRLVVYTAAGMSADGSLPGLDESVAAELRDLLVRRGGDDGV